MVPSSARMSEYTRGNSRESTQRLFQRSECRTGGHGARPVEPGANGRRQGVPAYVLAAPLAPGGVSWGLGANPRAEDGPVHNDLEVTR
jgi:hypothetical protein